MTREAVSHERLTDATVVVLDVFLATTTLLTLLENGAKSVFPVDTLEEASEVGGRLPETPIYGGEQNARSIEGYDRGPLPDEYPASLVSGRDVVFVTSNGTRALSAASTARELLIGCLRNAPAVSDYLRRSNPEKLCVVCAGSGGQFTLEDFIGAAVILSRLGVAVSGENGPKLNDAAWLALEASGSLAADPLGALRESRAGRWFAANDQEHTLRFAGDVGGSDLVPAVENGVLLHPRRAAADPG